ncbi:MAG: hypothetical protein ACEQR8_05915 [Cypionkella sp.]
MPIRALSLLTLLALLFAPVKLVAAAGAAAPAAEHHAQVADADAPATEHHAQVADADAHCSERAAATGSPTPDTQGPAGDCLTKCALACSSSLPPGPAPRFAGWDSANGAGRVPPSPALDGLGPEAADPPPRLA